jgi:hypothetical protein
MRLFATEHLHRHLSAGAVAPPADEPQTVAVPADTMRAVRSLVGPEGVSAFFAAAAEREVQARTLDALASNASNHKEVG